VILLYIYFLTYQNKVLMKTKKLNEKDLLTGKLMAYSAAAGAILAISPNAEAQVAYTDVDPDSTLMATKVDTTSIFEIDMNGDGAIDVTVIHGNGDWYYDPGVSNWISVRALPGEGAELAVASTYIEGWGETYTFAARFDAEVAIEPDMGTVNYWYGAGTAGTSFQLGWFGTYADGTTYNTSPFFGGEDDKYLGVRFTLDEGASYHYGWVRLDVADKQANVIVMDYAWEQTADMAIAAGDMGSVSVRNDLKNDLAVKLFSLDRSIIVSDLKVDQARAEVFNISGQLVRSVQVEKGRTEIPMESTGIFIVKIDMGAEIVSIKVIVR
jgi:hypothetical protein